MSFTEKIIKENAKEFKNYMGRGDLYLEQNNSQQALQEYINAISSLSFLLSFINPDEKNNPSTSTQIMSLTSLTQILLKILRCYLGGISDHRKFLFVLWYAKDTYTSLGQLEKYLDVKALQAYQNYGQEIDRYFKDPNLGESVEVLVRGISEMASTKQGLAEIDSGDEDFKQLRENMDKICALEICPVRPQSINYSSTSTSSEGCFIATAAYSTPFHPDLHTFRRFRDRKLMSNFLGKFLVRLYYRFSPKMAYYLNRNLLLKEFVRRRLEHLAAWMRKHEN